MADLLDEVCQAIGPTDPRGARLSRMRQLTVARPAGSLGQLDQVAHRVAEIRGFPDPAGPLPAVVSVLAGDHGVAERGISAFPPTVTSSVLELISAGRAPVNVLAARVPADVVTADFGLRTPVGDQRYKTAAGTADISRYDAMSPGQARRAVNHGIAYARQRLGVAPLLAVGEVGVGNTTATAALAARLLEMAPDALVGAGSGVDAATVAHKRELVTAALRRTRVRSDDPIGLLAALGGFEIAGNVGVILTAASQQRVVIIDGYITAVAALLAVRLCAGAAEYLVASHRSAEPGHAAVLAALGQEPLLELGMRLGMASGAVLALTLINSTLAVHMDTPPARTVDLSRAR